MKHHILFFALFTVVAATINFLNAYHLSPRYAYLFGSLLFAIPFTWFCITRKDLIRLMLVCGTVGVPFGVSMEYLFYTKDWWLPQTVTSTRIGIEDVLYSFFHGALLPTTSLVLLRKNLSLQKDPFKMMSVGTIKIGSAILVIGIAGITILNIPSFILTTITFTTVGIIMLTTQPKLLKVGLVGILGTLGWCVPVFWITNSFFPSWIQNFWINNTNRILILQIPLPDLCWYASVGFSAAILPEALTRRPKSRV